MRTCCLQVLRGEEAVSRAEGEAATARSRALHHESAVRVKDKELERLARVLEQAKTAEYELTAQHMQVGRREHC